MNRSPLRIDFPDHLNRAARVRASSDGIEVNDVIASAPEACLKEELETLLKKQQQHDGGKKKRQDDSLSRDDADDGRQYIANTLT